jgi:hypothetical protein
MLHNHLHLPQTYNVRNCNHLLSELKSIERNSDMRIFSFDIEYIYIYIPKINIINIINSISESNTVVHTNIRNEK